MVQYPPIPPTQNTVIDPHDLLLVLCHLILLYRREYLVIKATSFSHFVATVMRDFVTKRMFYIIFTPHTCALFFLSLFPKRSRSMPTVPMLNF